MNHGQQYIIEQARESAALCLRQAATFAGLNVKQPLFYRRKGKGGASVWVRYEFPGVLSVICPDTDEVLAKSLPGQPGVLDPDFMPPVPSLPGNGSHRNTNGGR